MKKVRTVLVVLSAIYVVLTIIFLLNDDSLFNNFNLLSLIDYLQAWIVVGLVLLTAVIVVGTLYIRSLKKRYDKLEKEHNLVKSRVYEIEEERKAEIARQKEEEEETERKLKAFNVSLKNRNSPSSANSHAQPDVEGPEVDGPERRDEIDLGRLDEEPRNSPRPLPPARNLGDSSPDNDKPAQP